MALVIGWTFLKSQHFHHSITWDAFGYYLYLPAIFIHDDIAIKDASWFEEIFEKYSPSETVYQINYMADGGRAIKYPIGLAMLWTPFFALGHGLAGIMDLPQDGLSKPYHWMLVLGSWCYLALGLIWLRRILLGTFPDGVVALTLIILVFGTNLLYMVVFDPLMPHAFLFTLYAGIIWYSMQWHNETNTRNSVILGILLGAAASSRNTELIAVVIPLLWGVWDASLSSHVRKLWKFPGKVLIVAVTMFLVCMPQLLYWKAVTGNFFYMSYTNAGEGLDLHRPHVADVLISYRKGLLIYTPIVVLALLGLVVLRRYIHRSIPAIPTYLFLNFWIVSSWTIWWYADSFGNRGFVQSYAALALPLAGMVQWIGERKIIARTGIGVLASALVLFTMFQTWQATAGILHSSRMTKAAYWAAFGSTSRPDGFDDLLIVQRSYDGSVPIPDPEKYRSIAVDEQKFEVPDPGIPEQNYSDPYKHSGKAGFRVDADVPWNVAIGKRFSDLTEKDHLYALYTIHIFIPEGHDHPDCVIVLSMEHPDGRYGELLHAVGGEELVPGRWNRIEVWYVTPTIRHPDDRMRAYLWSRDGVPVWVDDTRLEVFEPIGP